MRLEAHPLQDSPESDELKTRLSDFETLREGTRV